MDWKALLLSPQGRINRAKYWAGSLSVTAGLLVLCGLLAIPAVMTANPDNSPSAVGILAYVLMGVLYCAAMFFQIMIIIKRFHDRDKSGWWTLIILAPYIGGIWIFVECGCLVGTNGRNRFGADPLAFGGDVVDVFGAPERAAIR